MHKDGWDQIHSPMDDLDQIHLPIDSPNQIHLLLGDQDQIQFLVYGQNLHFFFYQKMPKLSNFSILIIHYINNKWKKTLMSYNCRVNHIFTSNDWTYAYVQIQTWHPTEIWHITLVLTSTHPKITPILWTKRWTLRYPFNERRGAKLCLQWKAMQEQEARVIIIQFGLHEYYIRIL